MLIFEKWYQDKFGSPFIGQYNDSELQNLYTSYESYRESYEFTMTFKEAFDFLTMHAVFNGAFMSCLNIKPVNDKTLGEYLEFEVSIFTGSTDKRIECYAYDPRLDVRSKTFEKGILILAALVKEAYGIPIVEQSNQLRAITVFNGKVQGEVV